MANKTRLTWTNPTQNEDNTPYDASTQNAGYDLALDGIVPTVTLPFALGTEFDMKNLAAYTAMPSGSHVARLRVVNKDGIYSDWSPPVTFLKVATPRAVSTLAVV